MSIVDAVGRVCKNWLIDDYKNSHKIDLITFIITSLGTGVANHLKKSIVKCPCQV